MLDEWTDKIYSNKMDPKITRYTDDFPGMRARHFYVLDYLSRFIDFKNKKVIDFACGQGGLLSQAKKYFKASDLNGVEHSKRNILLIKKSLKKIKSNYLDYINQILKIFL